MSALHHPHCTCLELLESGAVSLCRGLGDPFRRPGSRPAECVYRGQGAHLRCFLPSFPRYVRFLLHHISHWTWLDLDLLLYLGPSILQTLFHVGSDLIQFPLDLCKAGFSLNIPCSPMYTLKMIFAYSECMHWYTHGKKLKNMDCINQYLILNIHQLQQICLQFLNSSGRKDLSCWLWFEKMFILYRVCRNAFPYKQRKNGSRILVF